MSGTALKIIAVVTMIIDHIGAVFFPDLIVLRMIGRLSMPIFCFLIVEGLRKTSNPRRYLFRLGLFAILSELPFDLAFSQSWFNFGSQNVFLTFFITALALYIYEHPEGLVRLVRFKQKPTTSVYRYAPDMVRLFILPAGAALTVGLFADYSALGFVMLVLLYFTYSQKKSLRLGLYAGLMGFYGIFSVVALFVEGNFSLFSLPWAMLWFVAALSVLLLALYNGQRGRGLKWFFYIFYPAHLLVLVGIRFILLKS